MNTKPFDLRAAKRGAKVVTRKLDPVQIVLYNSDPFAEETRYPIKAIVNFNGTHMARYFTKDGRYKINREDNFDLMMLTDDTGNYIYS